MSKASKILNQLSESNSYELQNIKPNDIVEFTTNDGKKAQLGIISTTDYSKKVKYEYAFITLDKKEFITYGISSGGTTGASVKMKWTKFGTDRYEDIVDFVRFV